MPVSYNPDLIASAYRPLIFGFNEQSPNNVIKRFRIRIINAYQAVEYATYYVEAIAAPNNFIYYGQCDVQEIIKLLLPPKIENYIGTGMQNWFLMSYRIIVEPLMIDDGLITDFGTSYNSEICHALCASTLPEGTSSLVDYYASGSTYNALKTKYNYEVTQWQDEFLTFIIENNQLDGDFQRVIYVQFYDDNNNVVGEFFYNINIFSFSDYLDYSCNVGLLSILTLFQLHSGTFSNKYTVRGGIRNITDLTAFDFQALTKSYYYTIADCVQNETVVLTFQNRLGAYDTAVFNKKKKVNLATKSSNGEKPLVWDLSGEAPNHSPLGRGEYRYNAEVNTTYELESKELSREDVAWIRELLESTSAYMQYRDFAQYGSPLTILPVVVVDGGFETYNTEELTEVLKIRIKLSNERILK